MPTARLSKPIGAGPSDERRQDEKSQSHRPIKRAKMFAVPALISDITDPMIPYIEHSQRHRYPRLRIRRTTAATDPLSATTLQ